MLTRAYRTSLLGLLRRFPAVTVLGPRQRGKTTFIRRCLRDLGSPRGYVLYPDRERYSMGDGVFALPAEAILARPRELARL
ncbi:MAG TPA: hypothetical protein VE359_10035 [Vicinamibacteria bacterium]|nr:hypothetical protein [Vicinamibacteria bacterium]